MEEGLGQHKDQGTVELCVSCPSPWALDILGIATGIVLFIDKAVFIHWCQTHSVVALIFCGLVKHDIVVSPVDRSKFPMASFLILVLEDGYVACIS